MKQLICGSLNGMSQTVLAAAIHTLDRDAGPLEGSVVELEFRDCGAIPGQGLLLIVERRMEGL